MKEEYWEMEKELAERVRDSAWNIEGMEGHGAAGRSVTYIGSMEGGQLNSSGRSGRQVYDYYRDSAGAYWYGSRVLLPDGKLVSMEVYIFGREVSRHTRSAGRRRK